MLRTSRRDGAVILYPSLTARGLRCNACSDVTPAFTNRCIKAVQQFLAEHPKVRFHFTPTYSSWLNQVELWFAKIQRDLLNRGIFSSVADLSRKIRKYIEAYKKVAKPFRWSFSDPRRRIIANPITGTAY
jgi:DDE superfamily endonuclease